ncbi:MAG: FAD binding domain-containing protein [Thermodesulfobacteriota bacterium]
MNKFSYLRPTSLEEALDLLVRHGRAAKPVAGGTDVIVNAKKNELEAEVLVSLRRLEELRYIREEAGRVFIGGLTTLRDLEKSELVADLLPALADAARHMASVQIRNVATVAGNIANAAPSADTAPPLLISDAKVRLVSKKGERSVALDQFFLGPGRTVLEPDEIIREFVIPKPAPPYSQAYWKHSRRKAMDLAMVSVGVHLELEDDLITCRLARLAHGVAAPTPIRTPEAEAQLQGKKITPELLDSIGERSCAETLCRDSLRGEAWYRREIIRVMVRRMALLALARARAKAGR